MYYIKIFFIKKSYRKALENLELSIFQNNENVVFLKTEISDLLDGGTELDTLVEEYKINDVMSDKLYLSYLNYLFLSNRIKDADVLADELLKNSSKNNIGDDFPNECYALSEINEKAYVIGKVTDSGEVDLKW